MKAMKGKQPDFDNEDDFDDEDAIDDSDLVADLLDDGYRVVQLGDLAVEEEPFLIDTVGLPPPTLSLEDVLRQLTAGELGLPLNELAVFSDLNQAAAGVVRKQWPLIPVAVRRLTIETLVTAAETQLELLLAPFLRLALDDSDGVVRRLAIEGLLDDTADDLLGRLVWLLENDTDEAVRAAAAAALGPFVLAGELDELGPALAMRAEDALLAVTGDRTAPLIVKQRALESLAYSGEAGVAQLIEEAYYSPIAGFRLSALRAMGHSADIRWRRLARAELRNPDPAMRAEAANACGALEASRALPDLLRLLSDDVKQVRLNAIYALGQIGGREAGRALLALVNGDDALEALAAEDALEELAFASELAAGVAQFEELERSEEEDDEGEETTTLTGSWTTTMQMMHSTPSSQPTLPTLLWMMNTLTMISQVSTIPTIPTTTWVNMPHESETQTAGAHVFV